MTDRVGQVFGNYRLIRLLGRGGFAEVYLGQHQRLPLQAAIKVLHASLTDEDVNLFHREAQTVTRLKHPHIIRILDFDVQDGLPFLVMEYISEGTLRRRHARGMCLPLATVVSYISQVAEALQYAHDHKVIHRDVKPENMLLDHHSKVILSDFGIALLARSSRSLSIQEVAGTATYMAPEQFQGKPQRASDQYGLGVVVYEWLSGKPPFQGSFSEIASQHLFIPPPPLREKMPAIERVLLTALEKDPSKRFSNVQAFALALEKAYQQEISHTIVSPMKNPASKRLPPTTASTPEAPQSQTIPPTETLPPLSQTALPIQRISSSSHLLPSTPTPRLVYEPDEFSSGIHGSPSSASSQPLRRSLSRRVIILGLSGTIVVGSGIWGLLAQEQRMEPQQRVSQGGSPLVTYRGHSSGVNTVAWSPDGTQIASGSWDRTIHIWNTSSGKLMRTYTGHSASVQSLAWLSHGQRITSSAMDHTVQVWNPVTGKLIFTYRPEPNITNGVAAMAWAPNERHVVSGDYGEWLPDGGYHQHVLLVWDTTIRRRIFTYRGHSDRVNAVVWSPDGGHIASASADSSVQVWSPDPKGSLVDYRGHHDQIFGITWSPDGRHIASASADNTVQVWSPASSSKSALLSYTGHTNVVYTVAWSPNGQLIASGSNDATVQVWEAVSGRRIFTYRGHSGAVSIVAWSPDGKQITSGGSDTTVQVWQIP